MDYVGPLDLSRDLQLICAKKIINRFYLILHVCVQIFDVTFLSVKLGDLNIIVTCKIFFFHLGFFKFHCLCHYLLNFLQHFTPWYIVMQQLILFFMCPQHNAIHGYKKFYVPNQILMMFSF